MKESDKKLNEWFGFVILLSPRQLFVLLHQARLWVCARGADDVAPQLSSAPPHAGPGLHVRICTHTRTCNTNTRHIRVPLVVRGDSGCEREREVGGRVHLLQ